MEITTQNIKTEIVVKTTKLENKARHNSGWFSGSYKNQTFYYQISWVNKKPVKPQYAFSQTYLDTWAEWIHLFDKEILTEADWLKNPSQIPAYNLGKEELNAIEKGLAAGKPTWNNFSNR